MKISTDPSVHQQREPCGEMGAVPLAGAAVGRVPAIRGQGEAPDRAPCRLRLDLPWPVGILHARREACPGVRPRAAQRQHALGD